MTAKIKCPFCSKRFDTKDEQDHHVTLHVIETIRRNYPGLLEMIEKVEKDIPVKFLVKVDTERVVQAEDIAKSIDDSLTAEADDGGQDNSQAQ